MQSPFRKTSFENEEGPKRDINDFLNLCRKKTGKNASDCGKKHAACRDEKCFAKLGEKADSGLFF